MQIREYKICICEEWLICVSCFVTHLCKDGCETVWLALHTVIVGVVMLATKNKIWLPRELYIQKNTMDSKHHAPVRRERLWVLGVFVCLANLGQLELLANHFLRRCCYLLLLLQLLRLKLFWGAYIFPPKWRAIFHFIATIGRSFSENRTWIGEI